MVDRPEEDAKPDRPLECSECKKPITVHYTEIIGKNITETVMCSDCPVLQRKLHGSPKEEEEKALKGIVTGLACGNCGTTLESIKVGHPLGCSVCYEVFEENIVQELLIAKKINPRLATKKKKDPLHIGRSPGEAQELSPSLRLLALNEALNETLKKEDYEQAAWLRDQIKELTEESEGSNGKE